jgi:hypothetical protein
MDREGDIEVTFTADLSKIPVVATVSRRRIRIRERHVDD